MNSTERSAKVTGQAEYAEDGLQEDYANTSEVLPRLKLAEEMLIEGLSTNQYNEYVKARVFLAKKFAGKLN